MSAGDQPPGGPQPRRQPGADERELAWVLQSARPVPGAAFRGALARHVAELDPRVGPRPAHLRVKAGGAVASGALLIALAALSATGHL